MRRHLFGRLLGVLAATLLWGGAPAHAEQASSCAGAAMLGGTQLICSHTIPTAPAEFCTFSWTLMTPAGAPKVVEGSFMMATGASNMVVYQSSGFTSALSNPIILCQGRAAPNAKPGG